MDKDKAIKGLRISKNKLNQQIFDLRVKKRRYGLNFKQSWELKQLTSKRNKLRKQLNSLDNK